MAWLAALRSDSGVILSLLLCLPVGGSIIAASGRGWWEQGRGGGAVAWGQARPVASLMKDKAFLLSACVHVVQLLALCV